MRPIILLSLSAFLLLTVRGSGQAEVRFGRNVFIGGHTFSHQTYSRGRRLVVQLSRRTPRPEGCAWRSDGGGRVRTCHLRQRGLRRRL